MHACKEDKVIILYVYLFFLHGLIIDAFGSGEKMYWSRCNEYGIVILNEVISMIILTRSHHINAFGSDRQIMSSTHYNTCGIVILKEVSSMERLHFWLGPLM